jgi:hypothetical protein
MLTLMTFRSETLLISFATLKKSSLLNCCRQCTGIASTLDSSFYFVREGKDDFDIRLKQKLIKRMLHKLRDVPFSQPEFARSYEDLRKLL